MKISGRRSSVVVVGLVLLTGCAALSKAVKVIAEGENRTLRARGTTDASSFPERPSLLVLAIDGVDRELLYSMLKGGELPEMAELLGGEGMAFPHAYFAPNVLTTFPSTTGVAWATVFTGAIPAVHGFSGNEFFVREKHRFVAPIPVSVSDAADALAVFTDGYANGFLEAPTIYELMREQDPGVRIWVSMSQFYRGADELLMTRRGVLGDALFAFASGHTEKDLPRKVWADLDEEDVEVVVNRLSKGPLPDVLTLYLFGTDDWAHVAAEGPETARRSYLKEVIDPALGTLRTRLNERGALDDTYVVVVSDHGHTEVAKDDAHALYIDGNDDPPAVLKKAGYRVRPFEGNVDDSDPFQSVLAYEGAIAYVYLADRSHCADGTRPCDWNEPPRYEADVLPVAEAFYRNNLDGSLAAGMNEATVRSFLGAEGRAQDIGALLLGLREGKKRTVAKDLSNTPR